MRDQFIDIRISEAGNKLAFRYDPETNTVQVPIRGYGRFEVHLDDLRLQREPLTQNARSVSIRTEGPR